MFKCKIIEKELLVCLDGLEGDTERQAALRNEMIKGRKGAVRSNYVLKVSSVVKSGMKLLD
jgi:hypothetical protein